jgi:hypothetical protein
MEARGVVAKTEKKPASSKNSFIGKYVLDIHIRRKMNRKMKDKRRVTVMTGENAKRM